MELPRSLGRKEGTAIVLVVVLVVVAAYMFRRGSEQQPILPGIAKKDRKAGATIDLEKYDVQSLALTRDADSSTPYDPSGRNLFDFLKPPPTPEEIARAQEMERQRQERIEQDRIASVKRAEEERVRQIEIQRQAAEKAAKDAKDPPPPPITFSYVAYVGPEKDRVAVLLDQAGNVLYVKEGEAIQDKWKVLRIGYTYVEIGYTDPRHAGKSQPVPLTRRTS